MNSLYLPKLKCKEVNCSDQNSYCTVDYDFFGSVYQAAIKLDFEFLQEVATGILASSLINLEDLHLI